jgi:hypothetical protein
MQKIKEKKNPFNYELCYEIYNTFEYLCKGVDEQTLNYLTGNQRGLNAASIKKFRLFTIRDVNRTIDELFKSYDLTKLKYSGLFNEDGKFVFSEHRLIIPYLYYDQAIYFRGTVLPNNNNNGEGEYVGLSGRAVKRLFNTNVLEELNEASKLLICDGEFDTIRADQQGLTAIGIPGVNNFPEVAKDMLKRLNLYICFGGAAAGKDGMQRVTNILDRKTTGLFLQNHKDLTEFFNEAGNKNCFNNKYVVVKSLEPIKITKIIPVTASELQKIKIPPLNWIIEGIIPEGLTMLAGRPKCGKSWMALGMALSVADGTKVLNKFSSVKSTVLYIALEDSNRRMQNRINNILGTENTKLFPNNLLILHNDIEFPKLNDGGLEALNILVNNYKDLRFIIIDTLGRSIKVDQSKYKNIYLSDYELMSKIQKFALEKRIAVLLIHHTKKGKEDNLFDEILGTTCMTGALDSMLMIKKSGGKSYLHFTGRDIIDGEYLIEFDQAGFIWKIIEEKNEKHFTAERLEIIELFKKYKRRMKTGEVAVLLGKEIGTVSKLLKKLVDDEILKSPAYGTYELIEIVIVTN